jgi:hypothetical protein
MKAAITLLITSIICLIMSMSMFGVSENTAYEENRAMVWEYTHDALRK